MSSSGGHGGGEIELPGLHALHEWIEGAYSKGGFFLPGWLIIVAFFLATGIFNVYVPAQSTLNWGMVLATGLLWMPILFGRFAMMRFIHMTRMNYNSTLDMVMLEMRIPRDVKKTPVAMESVFAAMHIGPGEGTWLKKYIWGRTRPWWSFEIVSHGGEIHFYVHMREMYRRAFESYMYAQYPEVEVIEAVDYSRIKEPNHPDNQMFACEYQQTKEAPYPIKTYVDYGLDKPGLKPEEQIDPFAQVLEIFGSLGPGEELWTQIVIRQAKSERFRGKQKGGKSIKLADEAKEIVDALLKATLNEQGFSNATDEQKQVMKAIERNVAKQAFDVGMRSIYFAPKDKYKSMQPFVAMMWRPFVAENLNSIMPASWFGSEKFNDYPWEDVGGFRHRAEMHEAVEVYRLRSFFHPPFRSPWMTMSTEELASIFHIPMGGLKTPSLPRIPSTTGAAPANLPQ